MGGLNLTFQVRKGKIPILKITRRDGATYGCKREPISKSNFRRKALMQDRDSEELISQPKTAGSQKGATFKSKEILQNHDNFSLIDFHLHQDLELIRSVQRLTKNRVTGE